jgi:hypothetical protein
MLGFYEDFPERVHRIEIFTSFLSSKKLQQRLLETLYAINAESFNFDEITCPTIPGCTITFEVGIADTKSFNYIDKKELEKMLNAIKREDLRTIDLFWAVCYYKNKEEKKIPLRFDYYLTRSSFNEKAMEIGVLHERGPRYISPEDLTSFFVKKLNESSAKKILRPVEAL